MIDICIQHFPPFLHCAENTTRGVFLLWAEVRTQDTRPNIISLLGRLMESWAAQTRSGLRRMEQPFISLSGKAISKHNYYISYLWYIGYEMRLTVVCWEGKASTNITKTCHLINECSRGQPTAPTPCPPPGLVTAMWDGAPSLASLLCQQPLGEVSSRY